jgi:hypothetical protein
MIYVYLVLGYIVGLAITSLVCGILDLSDEYTAWIALGWPIVIPLALLLVIPAVIIIFFHKKGQKIGEGL